MKQVVFILILSSLQIACSKFGTGTVSAPVSPVGEIAPAEEYSTMTVSGPFLADGSTPADVRILIADKNGTPVSGVEVVLKVSGDRNVVIPCTTTDDDGRSACTVFSTYAENKYFVAEAAKVTLAKSVDFLLPAAQRVSISTVSSGDEQKASGGQVILSSTGSTESPLSSKDVNGTTRLLSSVLATML